MDLDQNDKTAFIECVSVFRGANVYRVLLMTSEAFVGKKTFNTKK